MEKNQKEKRSWDKAHLWEEELDGLKSILNTTPLVETEKWGAPVYTYNGKNVVGVAGFTNFFTLWFYKGVFLKDDAGVLVNANEENTKSLRQWRFTCKDEINDILILQYVYEAIEVEKAGMAINPEKKAFEIPEYLQLQLNADSELKAAFEAFSPYKQKEFCEAIATAKQEKTKVSRFEKMKPLILEGRGLNDKYR